MKHLIACAVPISLLASACTESAVPPPTGGGTAGEGVELSVDVPATGRAFVNLSTPEVLTLPDDGMSSSEWDLAFTGHDVFTNSGLSGPGDGGAFPLDYEDYDTGSIPSIPFLIEDDAGGAFSDWYAYDPAEHVIYSRFHVFGVASAGRYFKVQIYTFYGDVQGAPVPALYQLQVAEVTAAGAGPATQIVDLDATAGGSDPPDTEPSACLALATGAQLMLLPAEAAASTEWDLCFRRALVSVNSELGGPGATTAADLDAGESDSETLEQVMARTKDSEAARFDAVDYAQLTDPAVPYHGDRILSAFSDRWIEAGSNPPAPAAISWLVQSPDGVTRHVVRIDRFEGPTDATVGKVVMHIKKVE